MDFFDKFQKRMFKNGTTIQEQVTNEMMDEFTEYLYDSPNYYEFKINNSTETYDSTLQDVSFNDKRNADEKLLCVFNENPIKVGDNVFCDNKDWLTIFEEDNTIKSHRSLVIRPCNNTLKYNYNGVNVNVPCIIEEDTNMTLDNNIIPTPHSYFIVTISENTETNKIPLGARLIFKNSVYKIIGNNDISNNGLLKLRIALDEKRIGLDDFVNGYANQNGLKTDNYSLQILNGDFSARVGDTVQLNVQLLNSGNIEPSTLSQFNFVSSDTNIVTINENGLITIVAEGICQITCNLKENTSITSSINITATNDIVTTNITYDLTPNTTMGYIIKKSNTNTFTAHKYDNNIELATTFEFDVNYNGLSTNVVSIVEKTNTYIKVKNISVDTSNPLKTIFVLYRETGQTEWLSQEITLKGIYG